MTQVPQQLQLTDRKKLTVTAVTDVKSFEEDQVILSTGLGELTVHGRGLQLKDLSAEAGRATVEGEITALIYQEPRQRGLLGRLFP